MFHAGVALGNFAAAAVWLAQGPSEGAGCGQPTVAGARCLERGVQRRPVHVPSEVGGLGQESRVAWQRRP